MNYKTLDSCEICGELDELSHNDLVGMALCCDCDNENQPKTLGQKTATGARVAWLPAHFQQTVALYFEFLYAFQNGIKINKAQAIRELASSQCRTHKSIECVMSNITSVLIGMGLPHLNGKPLNHPHTVLQGYIQQYLDIQSIKSA